MYAASRTVHMESQHRPGRLQTKPAPLVKRMLQWALCVLECGGSVAEGYGGVGPVLIGFPGAFQNMELGT